jgi:hypothetical protein
MGEVVEFPGFDERKWDEIEATFRDYMLGQGMPREAVEWVLADMKPRILAVPNRGTVKLVDLDTSDAVAAIKEAVLRTVAVMRETTSAMLGQIFTIEMELYWAKFGGNLPPMPSDLPQMTAKILELFPDKPK